MRKKFMGIDAIEVRDPDGAVALVAVHGAHVLSWTPAGGEPVLYLSDKSQFGPGSAIRGGVPIIFPQFGERGNGKRHGFARVQDWNFQSAGIEGGYSVARFRLAQNALGGDTWQHGFQLDYQISLHAQQLKLKLEVCNTSGHPWEFCAALHTYLRVADVSRVTVTGLHGRPYLDQVAGGMQCVQEHRELRIEGEIDRIYGGVTEQLQLDDGVRPLKVDKLGFKDVVVWNPGWEKAASLADMVPSDFATFLCVEAGAILEPVHLLPGQCWSGEQVITAGAQ